jgi:hypothetical protein
MALGSFSYINRFLDGSISGSLGWSTEWPLANLLTEEDYVGAPARCLDAHDLAKTWFELVLPQPRVLDMAALFFHTLSLNARYRIRGALLEDVNFAAPTTDTAWQWVYPSLYDPIDLQIDDENFITGTVTQEEIDLLGRHLFAPLTLTPGLAQRFRIELDDQLHPDGVFDVGGVYGAAGFSPAMNFDRERDLSVVPRDVIDTTPAGRKFFDPLTPMRVFSASYSNLTEPEARRFVDVALRVRNIGTVLFIPNLDDVAATMREAFPATLGKLPSASLNRPAINRTALTFEEIIA